MNVFKRIWQNIKQHFNAFRTDAFSIKNKGSWINYLFIFIGIIGGILILFSNFFVSDKVQYMHSKTGKYYKIDTSNEVKIDKWLWNKKTNTLDVILEYNTEEDSNIQEDVNYSYIARANDNPKNKLKIKTISKTSNREALRINGVKNKFEVLGLEIYSKAEGNDKQKVKSLFANEKKVSISNKDNLKNQQQYLLEFIKNDQNDVNKSIAKSKKTIKKYKNKIKNKNADINKLDDEKEYQTKSEKNETDTKIGSLKDEVREYELEIDREKEKLNEDKEAKRLLKSKYKDTKEFNE